MQSIEVSTIADLMSKGPCVIKNVMDMQVVRTLSIKGDDCHCLAGDGTELDIPLATELAYQSWVMDRGSLLFDYDGEGMLKMCTELDVLELPSGEQFSIKPSDAIVNKAIKAAARRDSGIF